MTKKKENNKKKRKRKNKKENSTNKQKERRIIKKRKKKEEKKDKTTTTLNLDNLFALCGCSSMPGRESHSTVLLEIAAEAAFWGSCHGFQGLQVHSANFKSRFPIDDTY